MSDEVVRACGRWDAGGAVSSFEGDGEVRRERWGWGEREG